MHGLATESACSGVTQLVCALETVLLLRPLPAVPKNKPLAFAAIPNTTVSIRMCDVARWKMSELPDSLTEVVLVFAQFPLSRLILLQACCPMAWSNNLLASAGSSQANQDQV